MDGKTFNLLYNIGKTLNEEEGMCSKNGCSFNSDFLNDENISSPRKKDYNDYHKDNSKSTELKDDEINKTLDDDHIGPVLGTNLVSAGEH